jgi:hypothetical protein
MIAVLQAVGYAAFCRIYVIRTETMSLAIPTNLANRGDIEEVILTLLKSLPGPLTYHIFDGKPAATAIHSDELVTAARNISDCSIIYVLDGIHAIREPIAGFAANESLRTAKLLHLIDDRPPTGCATIQRRTMEMLGVYIRYLYSDFDWVDRVTVPSNVKLIDGLFNLRVSGDDISCITLTDAKHRPRSLRPLGG